MTLIFDGRVGVNPVFGSNEWHVLVACSNKEAWPKLRAQMLPGDFEEAIDTLRRLGWGFVWTVIQ